MKTIYLSYLFLNLISNESNVNSKITACQKFIKP